MYGKSNMKIHITICKINSQWEFAIYLRKLKQQLCITLEGWDGEGDGNFKKEGIYVYLWLIHVEVWQKTAKFSKTIILQQNTKWFFRKASILWHSAFFRVQLSQPYMTTGETKALTRQSFVGKVMSQLYNMLSRLVITFLPRSKCLLVSWLHPPSTVILEPPKINYVTVAIVSPSICHEVMGRDAMILAFWMLSCKPTFSTLLFHFHQEAL